MHHPLVKVCGVTRQQDVLDAVRAGVDWLGLNLWPGSKRYVDLHRATELAAVARSESASIVLVGVFVNQPTKEVIASLERIPLDYVQLHGDETPEECAQIGDRALKAIAVSSLADVQRLETYPCDTFVVDTPCEGYGGSGRTFDWGLARAAVATGRRIVLAGGLTAANVAKAVDSVQPFAVDVASGVEASPGIKDPTLIREFVAALRRGKEGTA